MLTQCFPPIFGGIESLMGGMADAIAASGRSLLVLADGAGDEYDKGKPYQIRRFSGFKPMRQALKAIAPRRAEARAELVIVDSWKSVGRLPARRNGGPRVHCLAHGMELPRKPSPSKAARIARAYDRADCVIANSHWTAEQARRFAGNTPVIVAIPPLTPPSQAVAEAVDALAARIGPASPLIVSLCRLEPRKGIDRLIEAAATLSAEHPDLRLAIAGGGDDRARLQALATTQGVSDRVVFLGRVDEAEKAALLARADIFAMPVRREGDSVEGFGIVYIEAGWFGAPSLGGREGGAADAVLDKETGLLCDGADGAAVTDALERLVSDEALRARLGAAARRHAQAQVWDRRLDDFLLPPKSAGSAIVG